MTLVEELDSPGLEPQIQPDGIHRVGSILVLVVVMGCFVLLALLWLNNSRRGIPGEKSPEVGFARDMIVHHAQAVELALLLYDRTENTTLKTMALDMMLSQQAQIGQMQGWLYLWQVPIASPDLPMTWMNMATEGLMPGMATDEQIAALRAAKGVDADRQFIQLMIPHHESALHMAKAILDSTSVPAVHDFARSVLETQQREIDELKQIAAQLPK
jgi:uncharacterized protein (DUF305 family)